MPRKPLIRSSEFPYHLNGRCNNKEKFYCDLDEVWKIFEENLYEVERKFEAKVHAFVLMPNHYHLLMSAPREPIDLVMQRLMWSVTKTIRFKSGRTGRIFGGPYHWSLVGNLEYFDTVTKYVYRNPVKAQICKAVEDYEFSTLQKLTKKKDFYFSLCPIEKELIPQNDLSTYLTHLNSPFRKEQDQAIQFGLRKTTFQPPKPGWRRKRSNFD